MKLKVLLKYYPIYLIAVWYKLKFKEIFEEELAEVICQIRRDAKKDAKKDRKKRTFVLVLSIFALIVVIFVFELFLRWVLTNKSCL